MWKSLQCFIVIPLLAMMQLWEHDLKGGEPTPFEKAVEESKAQGYTDYSELKTPPTIPPRPRSFYDNVYIIQGEKSHTVVPIGGILHLPETLSEKIVESPNGMLVSFEKFIQANKTWITTQEVSMEMARGKPELIQPLLNRLALERRMVIATNEGSLIAIMHPVEN